MAKKEKAEKAEKVESPAQPTANGITRPKDGTLTGRVWEISDKLSADAKSPAPRGDVMKAGEAEGLNPATIATQYGRWRKFHGIGRVPSKKAAAKAEVEKS